MAAVMPGGISIGEHPDGLGVVQLAVRGRLGAGDGARLRARLAGGAETHESAGDGAVFLELGQVAELDLGHVAVFVLRDHEQVDQVDDLVLAQTVKLLERSAGEGGVLAVADDEELYRT